jgi:hypothetical protein
MASVTPESSFGSNITHARVPNGQPRGHPMRRCPSRLVGDELELCVPSVGVRTLRAATGKRASRSLRSRWPRGLPRRTRARRVHTSPRGRPARARSPACRRTRSCSRPLRALLWYWPDDPREELHLSTTTTSSRPLQTHSSERCCWRSAWARTRASARAARCYRCTTTCCRASARASLPHSSQNT